MFILNIHVFWIYEDYLQRAKDPTSVRIREVRFDMRLLEWDHPHVCGEYDSESDYQQTWQGSPPRVWGIRLLPG